MSRYKNIIFDVGMVKSTILLYYERNAEKPLLLILVHIQNLRN